MTTPMYVVITNGIASEPKDYAAALDLAKTSGGIVRRQSSAVAISELAVANPSLSVNKLAEAIAQQAAWDKAQGTAIVTFRKANEEQKLQLAVAALAFLATLTGADGQSRFIRANGDWSFAACQAVAIGEGYSPKRAEWVVGIAAYCKASNGRLPAFEKKAN